MDREGDRGREHSCLPGCCSLGPLTGASALFSNTASRQQDKTQTLIYTSLHLSISFCFSVLCYPLISALVFVLPSACVHLSDYVLLPVCVSIFLLCVGVQADRNSQTGSHRLHQVSYNYGGGNSETTVAGKHPLLITH